MVKKDNSLIIIGIITAAVLLYMGSQGMFKGIFSGVAPETPITPTPNQPVYTSCSQVCSQQGFSKYYTFIDSCKAGETKAIYGYAGQNPLLTCCCFNEQTQSCVDSDGRDKDTPGHVTSGDVYYDRCLDVGQAVTEYTCVNGAVHSENLACDYGETCIQTRSGGHCVISTNPWHPGDTVFQGSGSGTLTGAETGFAELDLSTLGITVGGNCRLGAQIQTSWNYATPNTCTGLQGMEGLIWKFYDSNGLEYQRVDAAPLSLGVDLHPETYILEWDGTTKWRGTVNKMLNLPNCIISDEWSIRIYIYSCD